jgi:hypothetical protein
MADKIKNIIIFSMHRSGSTYLGARAAYGLGLYYGLEKRDDPRVRNLGELTGWGAYFPEHHRTPDGIREIREIPRSGGDIMADKMVRWKIEEGNLMKYTGIGSLMGEIANREQLLNSMEWNNNVIIKIQPWATWPQMLDRLSNAALKSDAHYVVLWRKDLYAWATSLFLLSRTKKHHGKLVFDRDPYEIRAPYPLFFKHRDDYINTFISAISKLRAVKDRVTFVETSEIDSFERFEWLDGQQLELPEKSLIKKGHMQYVDKDDRPLTKDDMIDPAALAMLRHAAEQLEKKYDWANAVYTATGHK